MIVYFSGTGNSRFVAEMLADLIRDKTVSAADMLKSGRAGELHSESPWIFVSPIYVSAPPVVFMDWIRKAELTGSRCAYFVMTCAGGMGAAPAYCQKLSAELGFEYMGTAQIVMPQNYLVFFTTNGKERSAEIIESAKPAVKALAERITGRRHFADPGMKGWELISTKMILGPYYKYFIKAKAFTAGDDCIGCGRCERVCPLNNIRLDGGKPVWGDKCTHCMACINLCPKQAIEYGKKSIGKPRYAAPKYKPE